ncbi:MAG: hypothetical protein ACRESN_21155, partial [Pseudomonas sp.]
VEPCLLQQGGSGGTAKAGADDCDFLCASHGAWSSFSNNGRRRLSARFLKCIRSFFQMKSPRLKNCFFGHIDPL